MEKDIIDIISFVNNSEEVLVLCGDSGNGKIYLLTKSEDIVSKMNGYKTISLYLGNGLYDDSIENALRN